MAVGKADLPPAEGLPEVVRNSDSTKIAALRVALAAAIETAVVEVAVAVADSGYNKWAVRSCRPAVG